MAKQLTPRQQDFVNAYANPQSDTYSNGTQSYKKAYTNVTYNTATANASRMLRKSSVQKSIHSIAEKLGIGREARTSILHDVATREAEPMVVHTEVKDREGEIVSTTETTRKPTYTESLKALDMLAKLSGDYLQPEIAAHTAKREIDELYKLHVDKELRDAVRGDEGGKAP